MPYDTTYSRSAQRALRRMQPARAARLVALVDRIAADPAGRHITAQRLAGGDAFRVRLGDWRVVYELDHEKREMIVTVIAPRGSAYR